MSTVDSYLGDTGRSKNTRRPKSTSHQGHRPRSRQSSKGQASIQLKSPKTPVVYETPALSGSRLSSDSDNSMGSYDGRYGGHYDSYNGVHGGSEIVVHGGDYSGVHGGSYSGLGGSQRDHRGARHGGRHGGDLQHRRGARRGARHGARDGGDLQHRRKRTPSPMGLSHSGHAKADPNSFKFDFDLGSFRPSQQHKLKQVRASGFPNDFLNLIRLYVVNWDVHRVINRYANFKPNICMKHCIHFICENKAECEYDHIDELRLPDIVFKNRNYAFGKVFCEYLLACALEKFHFNNLDYSMIYRFYGWAIRQSAQTMNEFKFAEEKMLKAIKFNPNNHYAHNEYALLLHNNFHNYEKAETHYKLSIEINPNHELYQYNYGWFLYDTLKKYEKCLPYFKRGCELMPRNAHYFYWYGMALLQLNRFSESKEQLKKALSVATQDSDKQVIKERITEVESKVSLSGAFIPTMIANGIELSQTFTLDMIATSKDKLFELYSIWYDKCSIHQIMSFILRFNLSFDVFISFIEQKFQKKDETQAESKVTDTDPKFESKKEECLQLLSNVYKLATVFGGKRYTNDESSLNNENVETVGVNISPIVNTQQSKENEKNILLTIVTGEDLNSTETPNANDSKEKDMTKDSDSKTNNAYGNNNGDLEDFNCDKYEKELSEMENVISKISDLSESINIDVVKDDNVAATEFIKKFSENVEFVEMEQSKLEIVWPQSIEFLSKSVMQCQVCFFLLMGRFFLRRVVFVYGEFFG